MFYDIDTPNEFCKAIAKLLNKNGLWISEFSYFPLLLKNFTYDQILPYLMKKPTCTKYSSPWIASPLIKQDDYIKQLKASNPNFIIYKSGPFHMDYIPMTTRLKKVNEYILDQYELFQTFDIYEIYKKKN